MCIPCVLYAVIFELLDGLFSLGCCTKFGTSLRSLWNLLQLMVPCSLSASQKTTTPIGVMAVSDAKKAVQGVHKGSGWKMIIPIKAGKTEISSLVDLSSTIIHRHRFRARMNAHGCNDISYLTKKRSNETLFVLTQF